MAEPRMPERCTCGDEGSDGRGDVLACAVHGIGVPEFDRGPWWWRLRCRVADRLATIASRIDPPDRTSASWSDGEFIHFAVARVKGSRYNR